MAIKIIKHGQKTFRIICPVCGCEFEYGREDLEEQYVIKRVKCPDCGECLTHREAYPTYPTYPSPEPYNPITRPYVTWTTTGTGVLDCDKCPNRPDPDKPAIVGDTPCTWCKKNQPYCFAGDRFPADYKGGVYTVSVSDSSAYTGCLSEQLNQTTGNK